ncbi:hypothetical protein NXX78_13700 [Bacteroides fragilis]|nr:hypothetical protein [Bacteroides fragilis]
MKNINLIFILLVVTRFGEQYIIEILNIIFIWILCRVRGKISFAASFGISSWEYTNTETDIIAKLLMDFSFVSVREDTAVRLCSDYLNINAVQF